MSYSRCNIFTPAPDIDFQLYLAPRIDVWRAFSPFPYGQIRPTAITAISGERASFTDDFSPSAEFGAPKDGIGGLNAISEPKTLMKPELQELLLKLSIFIHGLYLLLPCGEVTINADLKR